MSRPATVVDLDLPLRVRLRAGLRHPEQWLELARYVVVGSSGYGLNLVVFAVLVHGAGTGVVPAATIAFLLAVTNNFVWNRAWTFRTRGSAAHRQAIRFLTVSVAGFVLGLGLLGALIAAGLPSLGAQALAVAAIVPLSFLSNKLWTFAV